MKIYKEKEDVTFIIGAETFMGTILSTHVSIKNGANHVVFDKLGINYDNRTLFCSKYYGYKANDGGAWPTCKSGDYEALSRLIHALQELCDKHNGWTLSPESTKELNIGDKVRITGNETDDPHRFKIGEVVTIKGYSPTGSRYRCTNQKESWMVNIDCVAKIEDTITQKPKVGDWVKCISHSDQWSEKFVIGKSYEVLKIAYDTGNYYLQAADSWKWYANYKDFILCESECVEPIQDDSEWKVGDQYEDFDKTKINIGDKLIYIRSGVDEVGTLKDCTVGKIYTVDLIDSDGDPKIHDDVGDRLGIWGNKKKYFKKIINNQTTTINYVKSNSNNTSDGIELCTTSISISTGQTYRGEGVSDSRVQIYI